ncbi:RsmD family RNA methyltransferase [Candidatus Anaplasma sp. TIGMIC]|uniref:RsmD family RNA methyltransferase n=1 Tax=Candidatus Anaplasma sp. TIGMIC TaxID=3020713 RepID=UPI0023308B8F|nr:RsmD family RNA methyltransferase [Candidatus Anaplasma sp. TIGMIC]MDB1135585.1 RsmD family RNA methyltransferase [Candidatus Anaplasma sp. TIGMIC]
MIRITSGIFRGRRVFTGGALKARPPVSIIRESVFNILRSYISISGISVCDIFCGSGSMSFEALSRGAARACLVDINATNIRLVHRTAVTLGVDKLLSTFCCDVQKLSWAENKHDLAFVDPPYDKPGLIDVSLRALMESGWCGADSIVVLRVRRGEQVSLPEAYSLLDKRSYCSSDVLFLKVIENI